MNSPQTAPKGKPTPITLAQPTWILYCHTCTKDMVDVLRPYKDDSELPADLEPPRPTPAFSMVAAMVGGFPVVLPMCLRHFMAATTGTSLLTS